MFLFLKLVLERRTILIFSNTDILQLLEKHPDIHGFKDLLYLE